VSLQQQPNQVRLRRRRGRMQKNNGPRGNPQGPGQFEFASYFRGATSRTLWKW